MPKTIHDQRAFLTDSGLAAIHSWVAAEDGAAVLGLTLRDGAGGQVEFCGCFGDAKDVADYVATMKYLRALLDEHIAACESVDAEKVGGWFNDKVIRDESVYKVVKY